MGKRILFLANHFITLYSFRRELIKKLLEEGHEVWLSLPEDPENEYFRELGCRIVPTGIDRRGMNPVKDLKLLAFYKKILSGIEPDIIFSYTIKPNIYGSLASGKRYRQVCNITGLGGTFLKKGALSAVAEVLYKLSVRHAYKVFFQNSGDRDFFIQNGMIGDNWELIPGSGCDIEEHSFCPMQQEDGTVRFLFIGRVMRLKGIDEYLQAAKLTREKYPDTEFIIAGWNEEDEYIKIVADAQECGYVNYIGFRKDIKDWIRRAHCTVLPSHGGEGVPNVLLESAAAGRVCIGSDISGTRDVIEDGVTGWLFEPGNAEALAKLCEKFILLPPEERAAMGIAGREKVVREFDRRIVIEKYMEEVRSC